MKIYLLIVTCLLFSCSNSKEKTKKNILPKAVFTNVLKDIHLAKAKFEIQKNENLEKSKNELSNSYFNIYKNYHISEEDFKKTLNYYAEKPEKLEKIYTNILHQLTKQKSTVDQQ